MRKAFVFPLLLAAALSFGQRCDALFNLDDDARNFLGTADTCLFLRSAAMDAENVFLACETSKFGYILPCSGHYVDGRYSFVVVSDSRAFSRLKAPACFESVERISYAKASFYDFSAHKFSWWSRWTTLGWDSVFEVVDKCVKWEDMEL